MRPMTAVERGLAFDLHMEAEVIRNESQLLRLLDNALEYWLMCEELRPTVRCFLHHDNPSTINWRWVFSPLPICSIDDRVQGVDG